VHRYGERVHHRQVNCSVIGICSVFSSLPANLRTGSPKGNTLGRKSEFCGHRQSAWYWSLTPLGVTVMQREQSSSSLIALSLIAGIVIAWAAIFLLPLHASTLATTHAGKSHGLVRTVSNSALKGDRLAGARATIGQTKAAPAAETKKAARIPAGCDAAFSKLVKANNFAARCVTSMPLRAKVA